MSNINQLILESAIVKETYFQEQQLRRLINSEYEAIREYQNCLSFFKDNERVTNVITDIINEEKIHVRELDQLLKEYDPYYAQAIKKAKEESKEK